MFHVKQYCLIGYPLSHSLSPLIHKKIGEVLGLRIYYSLMPCEQIDINSLKTYQGFNVTMPHKQNIIPYLDNITETAEKIHSVNTVKVEEGKLTGHSTDGEGFIRDFLRVFNTDFYNKNVCILGTGATSRAISYEILKQCPKNIYYLSRSKEGKNILSYSKRDIIKNCQIIINTTPAGMGDDSCLLNENDINENMLVYDVIYNKKTPLISLSERKEAKARGGIGMLIYQALLAWEYWEEIFISKKDCEKIVREVTNEKR